MARSRITVGQLAREAEKDIDEALIMLWDAGFDAAIGPEHLIAAGDTNRARRALGLPTRRELASPSYWCTQLAMDEKALLALLAELGVSRLFEGGRLTKKAIHRLRSEARNRGVAKAVLAQREERSAPLEVAPLVWRAIGRERGISHLNPNDIRAIHEALVEDFLHHSDPIDPPGLRSQALLESAANRTRTSLAGAMKYPTVEMAAASLLHALVHDHPFHNGNKRTALVALLVFLDLNSLVLTCEEEALFKLVLQLAQHALAVGPRAELPDREVLHVAQWLRDNTRFVEKGDRAIPWRQLRRIVNDFACECEIPATVGNRLNISRVVQSRPNIFGRIRIRTLRTQVAYGDEGREVDKGTINKIRRDLELDDEHGIDSGAFYDRSAITHSDFIIRYRKTLRRLARL